MNASLRFAFFSALCVFLTWASPCRADIDPASGARLTTYPNPPPANQVFDAALVILAHPDAFGIARDGPTGPVTHRITETTVDIMFGGDDCPFFCDPSKPPRAIRYQFPFPALPPGPHTVRFVTGFDVNARVLASFPMTPGGVPTAATLPVGGGMLAALLVALLAAAAAWQLRYFRRTS